MMNVLYDFYGMANGSLAEMKEGTLWSIPEIKEDMQQSTEGHFAATFWFNASNE